MVLICGTRVGAPAGDRSPGAHCVHLYCPFYLLCLWAGLTASWFLPSLLGGEVQALPSAQCGSHPKGGPLAEVAYPQRASRPPSESTSMPIPLWLQMESTHSGPETSALLPGELPQPVYMAGVTAALGMMSGEETESLPHTVTPLPPLSSPRHGPKGCYVCLLDNLPPFT